MSFDAISAMRDAGYPVDVLSQAQRDVFGALKKEEVDVLISVHQRLQEVGTEVEGHDLKML